MSGDFIEKTDQVPEADLVTMDRVICCYPDAEALLSAALGKARRTIGLVFPREDVYVRIGTKLANWVLRLMGSDFQAFIHSHETIERMMAQNGFRLVKDTRTLVWRVALFSRISQNGQESEEVNLGQR
jgi:magnesium-protoporphyrin O-methyltransferase